MQQDFKPFSKVMTKIEGKKLDSSYELYLSLYQQLAGDEKKEPFRAFNDYVGDGSWSELLKVTGVCNRYLHRRMVYKRVGLRIKILRKYKSTNFPRKKCIKTTFFPCILCIDVI